jgi:hypothetical protein
MNSRWLQLHAKVAAIWTCKSDVEADEVSVSS